MPAPLIDQPLPIRVGAVVVTPRKNPPSRHHAWFRLVLGLACLSAGSGFPTAALAAPKPLNEWFLADMLRTPEHTTAATAVRDTLGPTLEWILVYNASDKDTVAEITYYYEDKPPTTFNLPVPARTSSPWGGHRSKVRRYWFREHVAPAGTWIVTGYPVGDLDLP